MSKEEKVNQLIELGGMLDQCQERLRMIVAFAATQQQLLYDSQGVPVPSILTFRDAYIETHRVSPAEIPLVDAISRLFSEEEIDELMGVYSSPLMQRMRRFLQGFELLILGKVMNGSDVSAGQIDVPAESSP